MVSRRSNSSNPHENGTGFPNHKPSIASPSNEGLGVNSSHRLLTIKQSAEVLGCSDANVYALVAAGELPFIRIGKRKGLRIDTQALEEFIESRQVQYERARPKQPRPRLKHIQL